MLKLETSLPEVEITAVSKPPGKLSFTSLRRLVKKAEESVQTEIKKLTDWVVEQIPEPTTKKKKGAVTQKIDQLKKVEGIFERITRFKPKVYKSAHDRYEKIFRIKGEKGYDIITLFNEAESKIINLYKRKE